MPIRNILDPGLLAKDGHQDALELVSQLDGLTKCAAGGRRQPQSQSTRADRLNIFGRVQIIGKPPIPHTRITHETKHMTHMCTYECVCVCVFLSLSLFLS